MTDAEKKVIDDIRAHLSAPEPVRHPGYVIGNHWLETAYSRICAGEAEANVLRDYGLIREEAFTIGVEHLRQENERLQNLLYDQIGKVTALRAAEQMRKQIAELKHAEIERLKAERDEAVKAEREACCKIVYGLCESDNVAQRTVDAIRARGET